MARRASGFSMRVLSYDVCVNAEAERLGVQFVSMDELLAESDFLSLHAALTAQNGGLIGGGELRKMKSTAYIINTARGALIDEAALLQALHENWIAERLWMLFSSSRCRQSTRSGKLRMSCSPLIWLRSGAEPASA